MQSNLQLARVPFYGEQIEAVIDADDVVWVSVKRVCEALGVAFDGQRVKLNGYSWAGVKMILTPDARGSLQKTCMIDLDSLPMWLVTIHPSKVAFETRAKLETFQKEAKKVLAKHFGLVTTRQPAITDDSAKLKRKLKLAKASKERWKTRAIVGETKASCFKEIIDGAHRAAMLLLTPFARREHHDDDYMGIREFIEEYNVLDSMGRPMKNKNLRAASLAVRELSKKMDVEVRKGTNLKLGSFMGNSSNEYRLDVLCAWRNIHDMMSKLQAERFSSVMNRIKGQLN